MVDLSGGTEGGPIEHRFDNWIFVGPAIFVICLVGFFSYKLIKSLQEKEKRREEKKRLKAAKKESGGGGVASANSPRVRKVK